MYLAALPDANIAILTAGHNQGAIHGQSIDCRCIEHRWVFADQRASPVRIVQLRLGEVGLHEFMH